jgi:hypothetical protein
MGWAQYLRSMLISLALALLMAYIFIVLMNPYGNLPQILFHRHVIMDVNQRFQYPAVLRSGEYDSVVVGTSSARLLDPTRLEAAFGGHFANIAMNDGRAWEQYRLLQLFLRHNSNPKTILFGLDGVWCDENADVSRITNRGFPEWIYDEDRWSDWLYLLNGKAIETAVRQLGNRLGLLKARIPHNGFEIFVPPDDRYDEVKAQNHIWGGLKHAIVPVSPPYQPTSEERRAWTFPALRWLKDLLDIIPPQTRVILAFMPAHVVALPVPGSRNAARANTCKEGIVEIGSRRQAYVIDFRFRSPVTQEDTNFWDPLHYRLPIAHRIVEGITNATKGLDSDNTWVLMHAPQSVARRADLP